MIFKQIKGKSNFSYVFAAQSGEGIVIDPSFNSEKIIQFTKKNKIKIKYIINTHHHLDHISGNIKIKNVFNSKIIAHVLSNVEMDIKVNDEEVLHIEKIPIKIIHTPGHSPDSICIILKNKIFTGDTLFVGECGRTDLSGGNPEDMYYSLFNKILKLDDEMIVYPGHDYGDTSSSTIGIEKKTNYTLKERTLEEFVNFMNEP